MGDRTKIEWTDATWNCIRGCSRVSEGCRNCYAERVAARFSDPGQPYHELAKRVAIGHDDKTGAILKTIPRWTGDVAFVKEHLQDPLRWTRPRRVFVNSMSDLFHEGVPDEWIWKIFGVMALSQRHTFQVLTKRPKRMQAFLTGVDAAMASAAISDLFNYLGAYPTCDMAHTWPLPNVWMGVSVEDQRTADERIPDLLETEAAVRWVSYEPALGPVDFKAIDKQWDVLREWTTPNRIKIPRALDWIVCGGESGPGARPMQPAWARSARDQCIAAGVPFFFKQWGEWQPMYDGRDFTKVGKKEAGRVLDGREWSEYPK